MEEKLIHSKENIQNRENLFLSKIVSLEKVSKAKVIYFKQDLKILQIIISNSIFLTKEGTERHTTWENSTQTLILGFKDKLLKLKEEIYTLQEKRNREIETRMEEFKGKLICLQKTIKKGRKNKEQHLNEMHEATSSTLQE